MAKEKLLYSNLPALEWKNGYPLGNGRIAAMIYGTQDERIALNHERLYRGTNTDRDVTPVPPEILEQIRSLLLSGKYHEGTALANQYLGGKGGISGEPPRVDPYQPAGEFIIEAENFSPLSYFRALDLDNALFRAEYISSKNRIAKRLFTSFTPADRSGCLCMELTSEYPADWCIRFERPEDSGCTLTSSLTENTFAVAGMLDGDSLFAVTLFINQTDGTVSVCDNILRISNACKTELYINLGASDKTTTPLEEASLFPSADVSFDQLLSQHITAYRKLYTTAEVIIEKDTPAIPLENRLALLRSGKSDDLLPLLWFNYGRYLLLSSCGTLPPNLQGKWNMEIAPPWECDYHLDINLQMCYWMAETTDLSSCTSSLFALCEKFVPHAREAAKKLYNCNGIVFPLQTDCHGRSTPESYGWAVWIGAAPWLAMHFWERWEYSRDRSFLAEHAYPFIKAIAEFYEDYLVDVNGTLQIVPSQSPENKFGNESFPVSICVSSAMDVQLCSTTLQHACEAATVLGKDAEKVTVWRKLLAALPALKIGSRGELLEWNEEFPEDEPGHRHFSHLIGLYPGNSINAEDTPELFEAAERSLQLRLSCGGGHTGWSRSWTSCLFARLGRAEAAWEHLCCLISDFATNSLLDLHPPRIFQIDGNFGGAAAVSEMLLRSLKRRITLLPALPAAWSEGKFNGFKAKNGFTVSLEWENSLPKTVNIHSALGLPCTISAAGCGYRISSENTDDIEVLAEDGYVTFFTRADTSYTLVPLD
ncbi:MAG: hypothetical protein E7487_03175 [Ruminococcaceae bacterium]|nr:hypothetical protein [Oscillospiraceae bacterium]